VDAVIDSVSGAEALDRLASGLLAAGGRFASTQYGADAEGLAARGVEATNFTVSPHAGGLRELARMADAGELVVGLRKAFPLREASAAWPGGQLDGRQPQRTLPLGLLAPAGDLAHHPEGRAQVHLGLPGQGVRLGQRGDERLAQHGPEH
jgi:hypothetical protein